MRQRQMIHNITTEEGFTFLELVVVILLLSILVTVASLHYSGLQEETTKDLVRIDLKVIQTALKSYHLENGDYPASLQILVDDGFLEDMPVDKFVSGTGSSYLYQKNASSFTLWSRGPNGVNDNGAGDDIQP